MTRSLGGCTGRDRSKSSLAELFDALCCIVKRVLYFLFVGKSLDRWKNNTLGIM